MKNIDVFTNMQNLDSLPESTIEDFKDKFDPAADTATMDQMSLLEYLEKAPRKIKRKLRPDNKFASNLMKRLQEKREESI